MVFCSVFKEKLLLRRKNNMSKNFIQTSSVFALMGLSLFSFSVKAMDKQEDEGSSIPSTVSRLNQAFENVRNAVSDFTHPGNSVAVANSFLPEMQEGPTPQFKFIKNEALIREECEREARGEEGIQLRGDTLELMNKPNTLLNALHIISHPFDPETNVTIANDGKLTVWTGHNYNAEYQLESKRISVTEGDIIKIPYKITVSPGSKVSFGLLSTNRQWWYGEDGECIFPSNNERAVIYTGNYEVTVPQGETKTSLVFRNYFLRTPENSGHSAFTIEELQFLKSSNEHR